MDRLDEFLTRQKLGRGWGLSPVEGEVITSYGLRITKTAKNLVFWGGGKDLEILDSETVEVVDGKKEGVIAVRTPTGRSKKGFGPETEGDDKFSSWGVDDLGDPTTFAATETVKIFEHARAKETQEMLDTPKIEHRTADVLSDDPAPEGTEIALNGEEG